MKSVPADFVKVAGQDQSPSDKLGKFAQDDETVPPKGLSAQSSAIIDQAASYVNSGDQNFHGSQRPRTRSVTSSSRTFVGVQRGQNQSGGD